MEIEIIQDTRNELLSRRELRFVLTHDGPTPSRKEIVGKICAETGKSVREVMTAPVVTVECTTSCTEALALMTARRFRHLPVVENGAMRGFLSIGDLVKVRLDEISHEAEAMRECDRIAAELFGVVGDPAVWPPTLRDL